MEAIKVNLIPNGIPQMCHASQYDEGRQIRLDLFDGFTPYVIQSGDTFTLNVRKPDNHVVVQTITGTEGNTYLVIETTEQMTAVMGKNLCEIRVENGGDNIGSLNFIMQVEKDVIANGIPSESVIEDLDALVVEAVGDDFYTKSEVNDLVGGLIDDESTANNKTWSGEKLAPISEIVYGEPNPLVDITGTKISGELMNNTTGVVSTSFANAERTDYIEIASGYTYFVSLYDYNFAGGVSYYNASKAFISSECNTTGKYEDHKLTIPTNAKYFIVSTQTINTQRVYVKAQAATLNVRALAEQNADAVDGWKNNVPKMNHLYVATTGNDTTGDGSIYNPFATIKHANDSITDNSPLNEYTIHVADGTYTDLQTLYAGTQDISGYQGVVCKSHVYYEGNIDNPENVVLEWDGHVGYEGETFNYADYAYWKGLFHVNCQEGVTAIRGFTLKAKNLRYALHIETSGNGWGVDYSFSDLRIIWDGVPDCPDKTVGQMPAIGTGCGFFEKWYFLRCVIINATSCDKAFYSHDARYHYGTKHPFKQGSNITFDSCIFNKGNAGNTSITVRNIYEDNLIDGYSRLQVINCVGISTLGYALGGSATVTNWRALVLCSDIVTNQFANEGLLQ